ncbi:Uncharacterized conserved protein, DUF2141 family [Parasphingorhabdus marina DSM 22363]|uniref:Uncharacterized conserved protein, DUF2141 family n=1 Tax=Parasphingorhabdus marina DSM 22363 TaxID=1123272 RepID=A0A1N6EQH8_9SPHN|nr:DUF2141 domain-containing protein [Parasphingorhabdus marina]SIN85258.1 Uncharacterized conserved protein, DUF2141 family [Parasphingorhabdus marina DSM 22363]
MTIPLGGATANQPAVAPVVAATLDISITNLRSQKGDVLVCLSTNPKHFPDCRKDSEARKLKVAATDASSISITDVAPGTYAVALIHDENANGKMDMRLFLPREGFGFSRNPKIGMGPPKFKSAQFTVGTDDAKHAVKMKYIL